MRLTVSSAWCCVNIKVCGKSSHDSFKRWEAKQGKLANFDPLPLQHLAVVALSECHTNADAKQKSQWDFEG